MQSEHIQIPLSGECTTISDTQSKDVSLESTFA
jgi:hypothetical protein